jgi:putative ABC transport system permease protein
MLAFNLLKRNWRSGELKLLSFSIILAVTVLAAISVFTSRLQSTLINESNSVLGADAVVNGSQLHNTEWETLADERKVKHTRSAHFSSMAFAGDEMHLASVKAVADGYPLRGHFEISDQPFTFNQSVIEKVMQGPVQGEAWVDSRLLPLLKIKLGDQVSVGELPLRITKVLIAEPDSSSPFSMLGARLLMHYADLPATNVIQPGSRIDYKWLLAAESQTDLQKLIEELKPQLSKHQRIRDVNDSQERVGRTLQTSQQFLLLTAVIAVLLAGVAISIAARQFSDRHTDQVALMKSLGASANKVRQLYFAQLLILAAIASSIGLIIGEVLQQVIAVSVQKAYQIRLGDAQLLAYLRSYSSGFICLICFALPALWYLPSVSPLKILRRELKVLQPQVWMQGIFALLAVLLLIMMFSRNLTLALTLCMGLAVVILVSLLAAWILLWLAKKSIKRLGGFWRLAFAAILRKPGQSLVQILVFSIAIMLLYTLVIVRTSLIEEWRVQIPPDAPNHFLVNIPPESMPGIESLLEKNKVKSEPVYPMMRARLTHINGVETTEEQKAVSNALRRELNITFAEKLAEDNKITQGQWWDKWKRSEKNLPGVSVEIKTANEIGLKTGDQLTFSIGGLIQEAEVASFRSLDWRSMRPNFFFIFEPGSLDDYSPTRITSIYLSAEQKILINELLQEHPSILVIELDRIIAQIQKIIQQVSDGVLLVLFLTLIGGCLVLFAAVISSVDNRKKEAGLLRALGSPRQLILGSILVEFAILGFLAGLIAIIGTEVLVVGLQVWVFNMPIQPHYVYWLVSPLSGLCLLSLMGYFSCRQVVTTPPSIILREAN